MSIIVFIVVFAAVVGLIVYSVIAKRKREQAMAAFAAAQGWTALGSDPSSLNQYLPTYLLNRGQNPNYDMAYQATVDGIATTFFQYQYTEYHEEYDSATHTMEHRAQQYFFSVVHAALAHPQPTVVLLHHSLLSKLSSIGEHSGLQRITLEGDFNKDFDTYMKPNGQVEALSLLTPDVMQLLADGDHKASLSFNGQSLSMSIETTNLSPATVLPLLKYVTAVAKKVDAKPAPVTAPPPTVPMEPAAS